MFKKRCGVPSAWQRFSLMPGYSPSSASKSSERLRAAHLNVSAPAVNLRNGGGMRRVMDTEPLTGPKKKSKSKAKKQREKIELSRLNPYAALSSAATVFGSSF